MPNLPELRGKVKIEFSDLEAAALKAKLLGDVLKKELGGSAGSDVDRAVKNLGANVLIAGENMATAQKAGSNLGATLATVGAGLSTSLIPAVVAVAAILSPVILLLGSFATGLAAALTVATLAGGAILALGAGIVLLAQHVQAADPATQNLAAAQKQLTTATNAHTVAVQQLETLQNSLKGQRATADQLQMLTDLQKQVTKTTYDQEVAQNAVNAAAEAGVPPLQQLTDHLGQMADRLGTAALPLARQLVGLLDNLVPRIERTAQAILAWFGDRVPVALLLAGRAASGFFDTLDRVGGVFGRFLDAALASSASLGTLFEQGANIAVAALDGLLTNLLRLSFWFTDRLPTYGPLVAGIMSGMGSAVQGLASAVGAVVDFFVRSWPKISSTAQWVWDQLKAGWNDVSPLIKEDLPVAIGLITQDLGDMQAQGKPTGDTLREVGQAAGTLATFLTELAGSLAQVDLKGHFLLDWLDAVDRAGVTVHDTIGNLIGDFERLLGLMGAAQSAFAGGGGFGGGGGSPLHLQHGGFAPPGSIATVGEAGPETLVMGRNGGYVIPNAGTPAPRGPYNITINVNGAGMNPDAVASAVDHRLTVLLGYA